MKLLSFGNMRLEMNIFHVGKQPKEEAECHQIFMIEVVLPWIVEKKSRDHALTTCNEIEGGRKPSGYIDRFNKLNGCLNVISYFGEI